MTAIVLRPYQKEAVVEIERHLAERRSTLLVLPMGCGKTTVFCAVAERHRRRGGGRVLVLAHREELIAQAVNRFGEQTSLGAQVEMGDERVHRAALPDVVVATVQSMAARLDAFAPDVFDLVIVDEAHHAVAATYRRIIEHFPAARVLGVTATPDRGDGKGVGVVFESVAYVYEIRDAIEQGFLAPIRQRAVRVDGLDFSQVRVTAGDLNEADLERLLLEEQHLHGVAIPTVELSEGRKTMVFATSVAHAHALAEMIDRYAGAGAARALDGGTPRDERRAQLRAFAAGAFRYLVNCALFTEGFDEPSIGCIAVARPTQSRALYAQMVGRGLRLHPSKRDALVLDFEGNTGRHALVSALDILDGRADKAVRARAGEMIERDPSLDVLTAIDEAARILADEERQRRLAGVRRDQVRARADYEARSVDPFGSPEAILGVRLRRGRWGGMPATPRQVETLVKFGVDVAAIQPDKGMAHDLLDALIARSKRGLCTYRQAKLLARYGLDPDMTFTDASHAIDNLSRHWGRPAQPRV